MNRISSLFSSANPFYATLTDKQKQLSIFVETLKIVSDTKLGRLIAQYLARKEEPEKSAKKRLKNQWIKKEKVLDATYQKLLETKDFESLSEICRSI